MLHMIEHVFIEQSLVAAFAVVGAVMWIYAGLYVVSAVLTLFLTLPQEEHHAAAASP